ncbi:MAG: SulP family inorganic anion transporter [Bacteroidia bacterium]|nr:SulP family inorganic anion transporter [Bacteroidia bacterium]
MLNDSKYKQIPADGIAGLKQNFSKDALSGFLVFLLALPLSLGIAKASDFPAIFGLVTAIIGGVVVSFFAGSRLTIKGPAAGLIVIASGAVATFGGGEIGWHLALGAIVVAGIIQILFGVFKLGSLADFFPGAAVHGMLAAIGIIIMSKQIHTLLGIDPKLLKGKEPLELLAMIPSSIMHENAHIAEIGIACLIILIAMSFVKHQKIKKIPAPLIVLAVAIPLGLVLHIKTEGEVAAFALVKIGSIFDSFKGGVINADFSGLSSNIGVFIEYVILFALIGSLESLLTAKAIDHLDPYKRKSDFNKDLIAVGIGNSLAGLLGGLPMISEVARSSANVTNGAKTRWANFFHGIFLLVAVLIAVPFIEMIPSAALAAMLIFVGFKLAHPKEFKHMLHVGPDQLIIFVITIIMTLATDLLIGVGSGIALEFMLNLLSGAKLNNFFKSRSFVEEKGSNQLIVRVQGDALFSNFLGLKKKIYALPKGKNVVIDLSACKVVDHTTLHSLHDFQHDYEMEGGTAIILELNNHKPKGKANTSTKVLTTA